VRELLRDLAAEGEAEHVDAVVAEPIEHVVDELGHGRDRERPCRRARAAGAGSIEDDRPARGGEPLLARAPHLDVGAEAVDQQQRVPIAPLADEEIDSTRPHPRLAIPAPAPARPATPFLGGSVEPTPLGLCARSHWFLLGDDAAAAQGTFLS
jgi:hypothetical protein